MTAGTLLRRSRRRTRSRRALRSVRYGAIERARGLLPSAEVAAEGRIRFLSHAGPLTRPEMFYGRKNSSAPGCSVHGPARLRSAKRDGAARPPGWPLPSS
jgi:hypothetical protein